jgi:hypothetical protein
MTLTRIITDYEVQRVGDTVQVFHPDDVPQRAGIAPTSHLIQVLGSCSYFRHSRCTLPVGREDFLKKMGRNWDDVMTFDWYLGKRKDAPK